jgi:methyl-accepting chemotaxis protein
MIKLNRIATKLGIAGLIGIFLSVGMVINQVQTESSISQAAHRVDLQRHISELTLKAESGMKQIQIAARGIRAAKTEAELGRGVSELHAANVAEMKLLDEALLVAVSPEDKEVFDRIRSIFKDYSSPAEEQARLQKRTLQLLEASGILASDWAAAYQKASTSLASVVLPSAPDTERRLEQIESKFNAAQAANYHFAVTGAKTQREKVIAFSEYIDKALTGIRLRYDEKTFLHWIDLLLAINRSLVNSVNEFAKTEEEKERLVQERAIPIGAQGAKIMGSAISTAQSLAEEARERNFNELRRAKRISVGLSIMLVLSLIAAVVFSFVGIARPISLLTGAISQIAAGNLEIIVPGAGRGDEIGDMARSISVIRENAEQMAREDAAAKIREEQMAADRRRRDMYKLADDFESAVGAIIETVSSASVELEASASTLTSTAERARELTTMVAAASEEASANVQSVASATEEMSSSVDQISRQVQESTNIANEAVEQARKTNEHVSELAKAAARIGDVVELINSVAGQTNLLALNATIEAGRAGEAGHGFAVVASEVKALASQTAKATGEISEQVIGIQSATRESVAAINEIGNTILRMSQISSAIASAVKEQGAATQEISRNVHEAAQGTMLVSSNITDVQRGAGEARSASSLVLSAAQSLSGESSRLKVEVTKFLNSVRDA